MLEYDVAGPSMVRCEPDDIKTGFLRRELAICRAIARLQSSKFNNVDKILRANAMKSAIATRRDRSPPFSHRPHAVNDRQDLVLKAIKADLTCKVAMRKAATMELRKIYKQMGAKWHQHCGFLDHIDSVKDSELSQRHPVYGKRDHSTYADDRTDPSPTSHTSGHDREQASFIAQGALQNAHPQHEEVVQITGIGRSNRRNTQSGILSSFGDAVRSEAEFLEILASLESADMQDPNMRAARTTAAVPDMMIDVSITSGRCKAGVTNPYHDDSGFVADPLNFYLLDFDPAHWSGEDIARFEKRYALFPKQFGRIASGLENKTTAQCVAFYYATKKSIDYKSMLTVKNRDRRRKTKMVKPKKGRGSALMADLKAVATIDELAVDEADHALQFTDADLSSTSTSKRGLRNSGREKRIGQEEYIQSSVGIEEGVDLATIEVIDENDSDRQDIAKLSRASSKSTSSYWSIAERIGFLRSLAVFGRDWDALASNLVTKSAAQARNFFVRNAEDADFVEAVQLARSNEFLSLDERRTAAELFVDRKNTQSQPAEIGPASRQPGGRLTISNLLNADVREPPASRSASFSEWFGTDERDHAVHLRTANEEQIRRGQIAEVAHYDGSQGRVFDDRSPRMNYRTTEDTWYRPASASGYYADRRDMGANYEDRSLHRSWKMEDYHDTGYMSSSHASYRSTERDDGRHYPHTPLVRRNIPPPPDTRHFRGSSMHREDDESC